MSASLHHVMFLLLMLLLSCTRAEEFCYYDPVSVSCSADEVFVATRALYGRMRIGRCLTLDFGLRCGSDVLSRIDALCSNKPTCEFNVGTELADTQTDCPAEMYKYLELEYTCVKVLPLSPALCRSPTAPLEVTDSLSLSSYTLARAHCVSASLLLAARPGQTLNLTLTDLSPPPPSPAAPTPRAPGTCLNYVELRDVTSGVRAQVCAGARGRHGQVMMSEGESVEAVFTIMEPARQNFILHVQAVGCADITPPDGTWVQRSGAETTLGCHSGSHSWTLTCVHNRWTGAVGSCGDSGTAQPGHAESELAATATMPGRSSTVLLTPVVAVFAVCSVFVLLASIVFTVGVCIHRVRAPPSYLSQLNTLQSAPLMAPFTAPGPGTFDSKQGSLHSAASGHHRPPTPLPRSHFSHAPVTTAAPSHAPVTSNGHTHVMDHSHGPVTGGPQEEAYFNTSRSRTDSQYSDSVKYYVLEDPSESRA